MLKWILDYSNFMGYIKSVFRLLQGLDSREWNYVNAFMPSAMRDNAIVL